MKLRNCVTALWELWVGIVLGRAKRPRSSGLVILKRLSLSRTSLTAFLVSLTFSWKCWHKTLGSANHERVQRKLKMCRVVNNLDIILYLCSIIVMMAQAVWANARQRKLISIGSDGCSADFSRVINQYRRFWWGLYSNSRQLNEHYDLAGLGYALGVPFPCIS